MSAATTFEPRAICARCRRPEVVCYCPFVRTIRTRTRVVVLQHPRERDVPINTARIASLCLPDAELHLGVRFDEARLTTLLGADPARPPVLLYPGDDAIDVEANPPSGPVTLVVVDGTWFQARKIVRTNAALASLPRYAFRPKAPSDYRIRREPQEDYVSTIEALVSVLGVLEGEGGPALVTGMLEPFRAMVDMQLAYAERAAGPPRRLLRKRAPRRRDPKERLPPELVTGGDRLVCVYGEANAWPYGSAQRAPEHRDELVQWTACRVATGETLEVFLAPRGDLAPWTAKHLDVGEEVIRGGADREELRAAWARFARPDDVVCAWGPYAETLFTTSIGASPSTHSVDLRRAARVFAVDKVGTTEAFAKRLGLDDLAPLGAGRAGRRLAALVAITRALVA